MKIHVQDMNSYEARVANRSLSEEELIRDYGLECEGKVLVTQAFLSHKGSEEKFRPYLRLMGEVHSISGDFPQGITEAVFSEEKDCPRIDYRYDFTNEELSDLCAKGLFDEGFSIPRIFIRNTFELPMTCDVCMVKGMEVPVMFVGIDKPYNQEISHQTSGYRLADYFEQAKPIDKAFVEDILDYSEEVTDMFQPEDTVEKEPVEAEVKKEPTERDKLLHRVLQRAEEYTKARVSERAKFLAEHVYAEEAESVSPVVPESVISEPVVSETSSEVEELESKAEEFVDMEDVQSDFDEIVAVVESTFGQAESFETEDVMESNTDFVDFEDEVSEDSEAEVEDEASDETESEVLTDVEAEQKKEEQKVKKQAGLKAQQEMMEEEEQEVVHREVPAHLSDIEAAAEQLAETDRGLGE